MPTWTTPKTDWQPTDYFMASDWSRINFNIAYIANELGIAYEPLIVSDGGTVLKASTCNEQVTDMLETLYIALNASWNRGYVAPRVSYGSAWNDKDLNIIESMLLSMKEQLDGTLSETVEYYTDEVFCGDTISVGLL